MTDFDLSIYPTEDFVSFKRCNSADGTQQEEPSEYEPLAKRLTTEHERCLNPDSSPFLSIPNCSSEVVSAHLNDLDRVQRSPSYVSDSLVCSGLFAQHRSNCSPSTLIEHVPSSPPHSLVSDLPRLSTNFRDPNSAPVCNRNTTFFTDSNSNPTNVCDFDEDEEAMSSQLFKDLPTSLAEFELNLDKEKRFSPPSLPFIDTPRSPVESCASMLSRSPSAYLPVFEEEEFYPDAEDLEVAMITESFENQMRKSQGFSSDAQNTSPTLSETDPYGPAYIMASQSQSLTQSQSQDRLPFTPNSGYSKNVYSEISTPCDSIWRPSTDQSCENSFDIEDMVLTTANSTLSMARNPSTLEPHYSPLSFDALLHAPKTASEHHPSDAVVDEQLSNATEALAHDVVESLFDNSTTQLSDLPHSTASKMPAKKTSSSPAQVHTDPQFTSPTAIQKSEPDLDNNERTVPEGDVVDSWEDLDSDDFIPQLAQVQSALDKVSIKNLNKGNTKVGEGSKSSTELLSDLDHVVEASGVASALDELKCDKIIRVDSTHAILVFSSRQEALNATVAKGDFNLLTLRPLDEASPATLKKVDACRSQLQPHQLRPQTNVSVARRLIEHSLGQRSSVSAEKRLKEREQLKAARDLKKQIATIWGD